MHTIKTKLTSEDIQYLEYNWLTSFSANRGNKNDASIDEIYPCKLTRANTLTENIARLQFSNGEIERVPFALFRGVKLKLDNLTKMLEANSTLNFVISNRSKDTHTSCLAYYAEDYSKDTAKDDDVNVVFIIPPELVKLKEGYINRSLHGFIVQNNGELVDAPLAQHWETNNIHYIELATKPDDFEKSTNYQLQSTCNKNLDNREIDAI
jgi:hypothetical protein